MNIFDKFRKAFENELTDNILNYWVKKVYDPQRKMFTGYIGADEKANPEAPLGVVMVSRILWTFSAAWHRYPTAIYKKMADEAFRILTGYFLDKENGGVFWEVTPAGIPINDSKQSYAQAFALYSLAEYSRIFNYDYVKQHALTLFQLIEKYAFDPVYGGYIEAFSKNWESVARDFVTPQGEKIKKSMNTHLHILEAYSNLYRIYPQENVREKIISILDIFTKYIINPVNHHFHMFFDKDWSVQSTAISYGHDIEGSWLLYEAAEVIQDEKIAEKIRSVSLKMAEATGKEALDKKGGLYNESDGEHWDRNFHWWPQAEAVVGFFNAFQLSDKKQFLKWSENAWHFIQKYQIDHKNGEWHWLITPEYTVKPMVKVSPWKCPYHNGRMCLEMIRRLEGK
jgi:cellobiose epimerase